MVVNNSYLLAPWAEVLYFADTRWWEWHRDTDAFLRFEGQKVSIMGTGTMVEDPEVFVLHNDGPDGLSEKPNALRTGSNGGYQAVNLAFLAGAKRILLLGYDMRFPGGRSHWHGGHPVKNPQEHYSHYATKFSSMKPFLDRHQVEVINCTEGSAIKCFPFMSLEQALCLPKPTV